MTPFQQLQVWFKRAGTRARTSTVAASVVAVALVAWLVVPVQHGAPNLQAGGAFGGGTSGGAADQAVGTAGSHSTGGAASSPSGGSVYSGAGSVSAGGSATQATGSGSGGNPSNPGGTGVGRSGSTGSTGEQCPPTVDQGTTNSEINVAVTIIDLPAGANQALGVPSASEQQSDWQIVVNAINASGGAACRKLVLHYYNVNPADSNDTQQKCLAIAASHPFLAIDTAALTAVGAADCIPGHQIPLVGGGLTSDQLSKYYPYYISNGDIIANATRNGVLAWNTLGYLSAAKGFRKLGILYHSCFPAYYDAMRQALAKAGVPDNVITAYSLGCPPGGQDNPADFQQAVLAFKTKGATDVTEANVNDFGLFTQAAAQQNWKPQYLLADSNLAALNPTGTGPNSANFDGAINTIGSRNGEQTTPGYQPTGPTAACNSMFAAQHQPPVYQQQVGYGGVVCADLFFTQLLIDRAPGLKRNALVSGMHAMGTLDESYPAGPTNFSAAPAGTPYGLGYWRLIKYVGSCSCWQVPDPAFHPPFA